MRSLRARSKRALAEAEAREIRRGVPPYLIWPSPAYDAYVGELEAGLLPSSPAVKVYLDEDDSRWWDSL